MADEIGSIYSRFATAREREGSQPHRSTFDPFTVCDDEGQPGPYGVVDDDTEAHRAADAASPSAGMPSELALAPMAALAQGDSMGWAPSAHAVGAQMAGGGDHFAHSRALTLHPEYHTGAPSVGSREPANFTLLSQQQSARAPSVVQNPLPGYGTAPGEAAIYAQPPAPWNEARILHPEQVFSSYHSIGELLGPLQYPYIPTTFQNTAPLLNSAHFTMPSSSDSEPSDASPGFASTLSPSPQATEQQTSAEEGASNSVHLPFGRPIPVHKMIIDGHGSTVEVEIRAKLVRNVFIASTGTWTCYRRNYLQIQCSYSLNPCAAGVELYLQTSENPQLKKIQAIAVSIAAAMDQPSGKPVELVQHTPKRDKGDKRGIAFERLSPATPGQTGGCTASTGPMPILRRQMDPVEVIPEVNRPEPNHTQHTFSRIQFKEATANNGRRRAQQQHYYLIVGVHADIREMDETEPTWRLLGQLASEPMVVRGRSPGHYHGGEKKDSQGGGSDGGAGGGSGGGSGSGSGSGSGVGGKKPSRSTVALGSKPTGITKSRPSGKATKSRSGYHRGGSPARSEVSPYQGSTMLSAVSPALATPHVFPSIPPSRPLEPTEYMYRVPDASGLCEASDAGFDSGNGEVVLSRAPGYTEEPHQSSYPELESELHFGSPSPVWTSHGIDHRYRHPERGVGGAYSMPQGFQHGNHYY